MQLCFLMDVKEQHIPISFIFFPPTQKDSQFR